MEDLPISARSVPPSHFLCIMADVAAQRSCAFSRRAICNSMMGINPAGLSCGSSMRHSIRPMVRES